MDLDIPISTGLDLELQGSIGTFRIAGTGPNPGQSIEVRYIETHIGFDPMVASNEKMLKHLEPVREIFDMQALGFDEIMQRDIDDARVSTELIPYLLDDAARGTIKFFPPIVIVVVPVEDYAMRPATLYPKVVRANETREGKPYAVIRSGEVGAEAFQFENRLQNNKPIMHDLARLKLNTNKVRLVIIDGQHRAMALLALYRNLKDGWDDAKRIPFKDYYREWTKSRITKFNLAELQLPVVVCTFPDLDTDYAGGLNIIRAARSTFLTLNKTARKVSDTRNILLNDRDLISHFLREALGAVKQKDADAPQSFRICNVELDQYRDRVKLEAQMACTGVSHVYYAIEHTMLNDNNVRGVSARSGNFGAKTFLETTLIRRLDGENLIGAANVATIRKDNYTLPVAETLATAFHKRYGQFVTGVFEQFMPFEVHCKASLETSKSLEGHANPKLKMILFEGQNIFRTFRDYLGYMERQERAAKKNQKEFPPEMQAILTQLRGTETAVDEIHKKFLARRTELYFDAFSEKSKLRKGDDISPNVQRRLDTLYGDIFTSVAFQAALLCGYFLVVEKAERVAEERSATLAPREKTFPEYVASLNQFFMPTTMARLRNLLKILAKDVEGDKAEEWTDVASPGSFHAVVFPKQMKPEEWPKYRYLLLELWKTDDALLDEVRRYERDHCRKQVFMDLHERKADDLAVELLRAKKDLTESDWQTVFDRAFKQFDLFQKNLGLTAKERFSEADAKKAVEEPTEASVAEAEEAAAEEADEVAAMEAETTGEQPATDEV